MNCLEFRRRVNAAVGNKDAEYLQHAQECQACAAFAKQAALFEHKLAEAIDVEVPPTLEAQILLRQNMEQQRREQNRRTRWMALAASVLLTVGLVTGIWTFTPPATLDSAVLAHINNELDHLSDRKDIQLAQANHVLQPFNTQLQQPPARIHYVGACQIHRSAGAHMVLQGEKGPVTVLLMPGETVQARLPLRDQRFTGVIVPTDNGSMAIVGERDENIEHFELQLQQVIQALS